MMAQPFNPNTYYRLTAKHNGQVLTVQNGGMDDQADVIVSAWSGGAYQQWEIEALGDGSYRLTARHSGKVLDLNYSVENQANVVQHEWHGDDNQRWIFEPVGDGYYRLVSKFSDKVLDVNLSDQPGNVVQHEWHGGDNQRWKIEEVTGGGSGQFDPGKFYRLLAKHNGQVLEVQNAGMENQADVVVYAWNGGAHQQWKIESLGDGSYKLTARHSGKVLDVNYSMDNQVNVVQHEWHGEDNQRWIFEPVGDGYYRLVAKFSKKVLDVNISDNPGNVVQDEWHGGDNQRWKIETVTGGGGGNEQDLTGFWQDDIGGKYQIRQIGSQIWWYMDNMPAVANVFKGSLTGSIITGEWADVPGGQLRNAGSLSIKVVNNNRLEIVSSTSSYGGSVWTRR
jgi:hypothetical protein